MNFKVIILLLLTIGVYSCKHKPPEPTNQRLNYSFFVAGHTYGNRFNGNLGLHPPFRNKFQLIKNYPKIKFGVLTGDLVLKCDAPSWDAVDDEIIELNMPVYYVPGNHDVFDRELYESRYSNKETAKTYFSFEEEQDLFIVLDANIDWWNISGEQLSYLKEKMKSKDYQNIFVFIHQLIWWSEDGIFKNIVPNLPINEIPDTLNYWSVLEPLFKSLNANIFLFAGDLAATTYSSSFMYYKNENIIYNAGGMGNLTDGNFLFVSVDTIGKVSIKIIALQGEANRFGKVEDFILP